MLQVKKINHQIHAMVLKLNNMIKLRKAEAEFKDPKLVKNN
jgi:hypothetical protein